MFVKYEAKVARRLGSVYWSWRVVDLVEDVETDRSILILI